MSIRVCVVCFKVGIQIKRPKYSRLKLVLGYFEDLNAEINFDKEENPYVDIVDVLDIMFEYNETNADIKRFIDSTNIDN